MEIHNNDRAVWGWKLKEFFLLSFCPGKQERNGEKVLKYPQKVEHIRQMSVPNWDSSVRWEQKIVTQNDEWWCLTCERKGGNSFIKNFAMEKFSIG